MLSKDKLEVAFKMFDKVRFTLLNYLRMEVGLWILKN